MNEITPLVDVAVAISRGAVGLHAGLVYHDQFQRRHILHLEMHERLAVTERVDGWAFATPAIDPEELSLLAGFCELRASLRSKVPYGFRFETSTFADDGELQLGAGEIGLTCATFVLAVFNWAKISLLSESTWTERSPERVAEDDAAQAALVALIRLRKLAPVSHADQLESEVGCLRFRVEEVAAASSISPHPVTFAVAEPAGRRALEEFSRL